MISKSTTKEQQVISFEEKRIGNSDANRTVQSSFPESEVVLKVDNISKKFCRNLRRSMWYGITDFVKGFFGIRPDTETLRPDEFWALKEVSFELRKGDVLGIIGANGSGKSTLLRVLTGIFPPDKGKVVIDGTVGGIIALGAGMHPHMTGRENIYLNAALYGMSKKEIDDKIDDIIEFSEIEDFMDAPLSTYSSGMKVRLGFSVAVHCQPEILLVDEVLAVGDLSFQNKCLRKIKEVRESAKGVIFISHRMENIELLCQKVLVVNRGRIEFSGDVKSAISYYENMLLLNEKNITSQKTELVSKKNGLKEEISSGTARLTHAYITNGTGDITKTIRVSEYFAINFEIESIKDIEKPYISVAIRDDKGNNIYWEVSGDRPDSNLRLAKGRNKLVVEVIDSNLNKGRYHFAYGIKDYDTGEYFEKLADPNLSFSVLGDERSRGVVIFRTKWMLK